MRNVSANKNASDRAICSLTPIKVTYARSRLASVHDADIVLIYGNVPIMNTLATKLRGELSEGAIIISNAYELPVHVFGPPKDVCYVETGMPTWTSGLCDTNSHLFFYEQTAESKASAAWRKRGRQELYSQLQRLRVNERQ